MLAAIWVLLTVVFAVLVWFTTGLMYTAGFLVMLGISGALLLHTKWIHGVIGVCCTALLLLGAFYFEPGWYESVAKIVTFTF